MPIAPPVSTDGSATAIPMLARTGSCRRCVRTGLSNPRWIPAATSKDARAASLSWITTTNSSPPVRETVPRPAVAARSTPATWTSTSSPAGCPYRSLISLNSSRSIASTATRPGASCGSTAFCRTSCMSIRLASPVSGSCIARCVSISDCIRASVTSLSWATKWSGAPSGVRTSTTSSTAQRVWPSGRRYRFSRLNRSPSPASRRCTWARSVARSSGWDRADRSRPMRAEGSVAKRAASAALTSCSRHCGSASAIPIGAFSMASRNCVSDRASAARICRGPVTSARIVSISMSPSGMATARVLTWTKRTGAPECGMAPTTNGAASGSADGDGAKTAPFVVGAMPHSGAPVRFVQVITRAVAMPDGGMEMLTILADVTGPRQMRAALARSETQFRLAMENAPIGMALADPQWRLQAVNAALAALFATEPAALIGRDLSALSHPDDRATERAHVQRLLAGEGDRFSLEKRYLRPDGQTTWAVLDVVLVRTPEGAPDHFVVQLRDVTDARMQSEMLTHRAMHDPLTGLANRMLMQEVLQKAVEPQDAPGRVAVLAIDLDEFKEINDRYGHLAGDDVLVHVAGVLRAATAGRGTVSRTGGDEFVVVIQDNDAARASFEVAAGIHRGLLNPVRTHRRQLPAVRADRIQQPSVDPGRHLEGCPRGVVVLDHDDA